MKYRKQIIHTFFINPLRMYNDNVNNTLEYGSVKVQKYINIKCMMCVNYANEYKSNAMQMASGVLHYTYKCNIPKNKP